jgi:glycosyltransferase involved in cell wall biosynthesis
MPHEPRVLSIPHSPGAAERAEQLLVGVPGVALTTPSSGVRGIVLSAWSVLSSRASVLYLVDVGKSTAVAAVLGRLMRKRVIVDTGDACYALAASLGDRSFAGLALVGVGEQLALRSANEIVVRGRAHALHMPSRATHIPDLPPAGTEPAPASELRRALDLDGAFVVGVVGSLIFSPRLRISYGWDLIEMLSYTVPEVVALIVGDGSGLEFLQSQAQDLGVTDRCRFVGRVPTDLVSRYVCATDIAISTQTNDLVGRVRTTGKLPLYLACSRPVLASHVGEAARLLGPVGWTIPYYGVVDRLYPKRLADAIELWRDDPSGVESRRMTARKLAESEFDVEVMRRRLALVINGEMEPA